MNDYKELVKCLREEADAVQSIAIEFNIPINDGNHSREAAVAIEQLVRERDAAVADIDKNCGTCKHNYVTPIDYSNCDISASNCKWQWRGAQEVDND